METKAQGGEWPQSEGSPSQHVAEFTFMPTLIVPSSLS